MTIGTDMTTAFQADQASAANALAERLVARMTDLVPCVVAFSGGVDSAVIAAAAVRADRRLAAAAQCRPDADCAGPGRSIAVTALSPSVAQVQREIASRVAAEIGIEQVTVTTDELARTDYIRNDARRCFACKQTLYAALQSVAQSRGSLAIVSGTNADDLGDYRPGIEAGRAAGVFTPLAELEIGKAAVRQIAAAWQLSIAELPASPCLSSRIAYGVEVTAERLRMIELAEQFLSQQGFSPLRVRLLAGELAKIEVPVGDLPRLVAQPLVDHVRAQLTQLGFRGVSVDLAGFRSGSMNQLFNLSPPKISPR